MAHCPPAVMALWDKLAGGEILVDKMVWQEWDQLFDPVFLQIKTLVFRDRCAALPLKDAETIAVCIVLLRGVLCSVRRADGQGSCLDGRVVCFDPVVKDLLAHHIGNDLYKIALQVELVDPGQSVLSAEIRDGIARNIELVEECLARLKRMTGQGSL